VLCIGPARPETPNDGQVGALGRVELGLYSEAVLQDAHGEPGSPWGGRTCPVALVLTVTSARGSHQTVVRLASTGPAAAPLPYEQEKLGLEVRCDEAQGLLQKRANARKLRHAVFGVAVALVSSGGTVLCIGPARPETPNDGQVGALGRVELGLYSEAVLQDAHGEPGSPWG
jgi:hypothetical protein